ncbi:putative Zn-dependent protease [Azomonas agilis]|uniref:Putative beta-barrel assembly-enhancing protease n=1 Tax=Azomonas agilis TaxID=116849 RepID=A0A562I1Z0_9GAMM|nr:tetratricopeptide repeat protein [Azomonas agilis]TWH65059.1 putative Zn-dependent protease [Azomonas agilis]
MSLRINKNVLSTLLRTGVLALSCGLAMPTAMASDLPALGDASSGIVSPEQEYLLGRAWLSLVRGQVRQLSDPLLKEYVETSVYRLAETSQVQDRRFEFVLLESPELNAFAAPGGIIGVNGGLFLHAETEAEYASVMAHELAHLSQRHFARGLEAQQQIQIPVMAAMLAGVVASAVGAADVGMAAITSSQAAAYQAQTKFSRQNEQEADRIGLVNLERAGYSPQAMPAMFERLIRQYRYVQKPPEFLTTHPLSESRVADTKNRADMLPKQGVNDTLRYQLMRARMTLKFETTPGISARQFRSELNADPQNYAARYGLALALMRTGQYDEARTHLANLLERAPGELAYNLAQVELDTNTKRMAQANDRIERLRRTYPDSFPIQQVQAELLQKQNRIRESSEILNQLIKRRPKDPDIWYEVAEVRGLMGDTLGVHQARAEFFALVGDYDQAFEQLDYAKRRSPNFQTAARMDARLRELKEEKRMVDQILQ